MINFSKDFRITIIIAIIAFITFFLSAMTDKILRYILNRKLTDKEYDATGFKFIKHLIKL